MQADERHDGTRDLERNGEAAENLLRHLGTLVRMSVEVALAVLAHREARGLADVMEKRGPA